MRNTKTVCVLSLVVLFIACRSLPPVDGEAGRFVFSTRPETFVPQWQPFAEDTVEGLSYCAGKISRPRMEFHALRADLSEPRLRIVIAGGGSGGDAAGKFPSTKVSSFVRDNHLLAGMNAPPFEPMPAGEGEPLENVGVVISGGIMLSPPPDKHFDALVFYLDGTAAIVPQSTIVSAEGISNAIGGFYRVLADNEPAPRALTVAARYPRSAAGISADSRFLYLLVIDGRRPGSAGATEMETALILRSLGAAEGINFDGGGSSALALRYPDGTVRVVNTPVHGLIPGRERPVAGCLGLRAEPIP